MSDQAEPFVPDAKHKNIEEELGIESAETSFDLGAFAPKGPDKADKTEGFGDEVAHELFQNFCPVAPPIDELPVSTTTASRTTKKKAPKKVEAIWMHCDQPGCDYKIKDEKGMYLLDVHKLSAHSIQSPYNYCLVGNCAYRAKSKSDLKKHQSNVHDIGVTWHYCDQKGCTYKSKVRDSLKRHKAAVHDIDVKWHPCPFANCTYRAKQRGSLKLHMSHAHDVGVQWHKCDVEGCFYTAKERGSIRLHKSNVHNIGVKWHECTVKGCRYRAKVHGGLKLHMAHVHDIGVVWHFCDQPNCTYKAKEKGSVKRHKRHVHNIDVIWYNCEAPACPYRAKDRGNLRTHMRNVHGVRLGSTNETLYLKGGSGPGRSMKTKSKHVVNVPVVKKDPGPNDVRIRIRHGDVVLDGATGGWTKGLTKEELEKLAPTPGFGAPREEVVAYEHLALDEI